MNKWIRACSLLLVLGMFVGCRSEVPVDDGVIPKKYQKFAEQYLGTYVGKMDQVTGKLELFLKDDKLVATYRSVKGQDILNSDCQSEIKDLKALLITSKGENDYKVDRARLEFNPKSCAREVQGRDLVLWFKEKPTGMRINASILLAESWETRCDLDLNDITPGVLPFEICRPVRVSNYLEGSFVKVK